MKALQYHLVYTAMIAVLLLPRPAVCYDYDLRLVGGSLASEGRVELYLNDEWGTVCDDYWDNNDAKVICRMLGYTDSSQSVGHSYAAYGQGSGAILLDDVQCTGNEDDIVEDCYHIGIGNHNCGHSEDASVSCTVYGGNGCILEPECLIPADECVYESVEYVYRQGQVCPVCQCAPCPYEPPCPSDCKSGQTEYYQDTYCQRCRCVPADHGPDVIYEEVTISVTLVIVVCIIALVLPLVALIVVCIIRKKMQGKGKEKARRGHKDVAPAKPQEDDWFGQTAPQGHQGPTGGLAVHY